MAVIHIFLKDFGDLYCVSIYALRYQQDNKNEVHLHQDILVHIELWQNNSCISMCFNERLDSFFMFYRIKSTTNNYYSIKFVLYIK